MFCQAHVIPYTKQEDQNGIPRTLVNKDNFLNNFVALTYFASRPSLSVAWQRGRVQKWIEYSTVLSIKNHVFVVDRWHSMSKNFVFLIISGSPSIF